MQQRIANRRNSPTSGTMGLMLLGCLLLLTLLMVVQVGHVHPSSVDADHCPICVVMHSAAPVAVVTAAVISLRGFVRVRVPVTAHVARPWSYHLFNRPPPPQV